MPRWLALSLYWVHRHTVCQALQGRGVNSIIVTPWSGQIDVGACRCGLMMIWETKGWFEEGEIIDTNLDRPLPRKLKAMVP
jgi:hypothetical protein